MNILTIDVGGTHVKVLATGQTDVRKADSGRLLTPAAMVEAVKSMTADWAYDVVSIGYPGPVARGAPIKEPVNLAAGWVGFDFEVALGHPVRIINDAAMQALGSDLGGRMLFLGLGTGLGSAMVVDGKVEPLELAHLPYKGTHTYEDVVGLRGMQRLGKKKWRREVSQVVKKLAAALQTDYVVLGGGNATRLTELPANTRLGDNTNAFVGGFRMWSLPPPLPPPLRSVGEHRIVDSPEMLFEAAAAEFYLQAITAVRNNGVFTVALCGGSTSRGLYALLANSPARRVQVPWDRTHFFWGDERTVPPDHAESNFNVADEVLLSAVNIPPSNVHRIHGEFADPADAAAAYENELRTFFHLADGQLPRFDLVLLGLGAEGHCAALFPGTHALTEHQHLVVSNWVGKLDTYRITLTTPVLNNAACIMFLISGDEKAKPLRAILDGPYEPDQLPAQLVRPTGGRLIWLVDRAAAGRPGISNGRERNASSMLVEAS